MDRRHDRAGGRSRAVPSVDDAGSEAEPGDILVVLVAHSNAEREIEVDDRWLDAPCPWVSDRVDDLKSDLLRRQAAMAQHSLHRAPVSAIRIAQFATQKAAVEGVDLMALFGTPIGRCRKPLPPPESSPAPRSLPRSASCLRRRRRHRRCRGDPVARPWRPAPSDTCSRSCRRPWRRRRTRFLELVAAVGDRTDVADVGARLGTNDDSLYCAHSHFADQGGIRCKPPPSGVKIVECTH